MTGALLLVLSLQALPQRDTRPAPPVAGGAIVGTITSDDAQPRPLRRARVTVTGATLPGPRTVITGDDGRFALDGLAAGPYTVMASKDGYVPMGYGATRPGRPGKSVAVAAASRVSVSIRLPRGGVITGTVTDIDGLPAPGVGVTALTQRFVPIPGERRLAASGIPAATDDRGIYRIYGLPAGEYVIAVQPVNRPTGREVGELWVMAGGTPSKAPLAMAQVFYPGATDLARAVRMTLRPGEERTGIDVQLQYVPLASVSGSLPPSTSATLTMMCIDEVPMSEQVRGARPDAEGRFSFTSVPPGQYRIMARSRGEGGERVGFADVAVNGEDVGGVVLAPQPGLRIAGHIVFEGDAPPAGLPTLPRLPGLASMTIARAGFVMPALELDGTNFKIEGIIPGAYHYSPTAQGMRAPIGKWWLKSLVADGRDILDAPLDLHVSLDDVIATFSDRASEVSGVVTDAQGVPVVSAFVVAFTTERSAWFVNSRRVVGVRTDRDGRYTIRNLPPGEYRVALAPDLDFSEWYDPPILQGLLPIGIPLTISAPEKLTRDLVVR